MRPAAAALLWGLVWVCGGSPIILPPVPGAQGPEVSFVVLHGAMIPASAYQALAQRLQEELQGDGALWVGILDVTMLISDAELTGAIAEAEAEMTAAGMDAKYRFICGHSVGAVRAQNLTYASPQGLTGQVLLSSPLTRSYNNVTYPVATLMVGGEKDGLTRISRMAESYHVYKGRAGFPVVVLPGVNHAVFLTGRPPLRVRRHDLKAEVSGNEAREAVAGVVGDFVRGLMASRHASEVVRVSLRRVTGLEGMPERTW
jgi:hypothetical protein